MEIWGFWKVVFNLREFIMEGGSVILAVVFIFISVPFLIWRIHPNSYYGVRVPKTMKPGNEEIWHKVNKFASKALIVCSIIMLIAARLTWTYHTTLPPAMYWSLSVATFLLPFVALVAIIIYLIKV
jgi:uncharacterized membrane protein